MKFNIERMLIQLEHGIERMVDVTLACALLLTVLPVCLCIAIAIKLETNGPILEGFAYYNPDGTRFKIYRFRTKTTRVPLSAEDTWTRVTITRVGRFLRDTGLDELPQLLNVIKGDTSLIQTN